MQSDSNASAPDVVPADQTHVFVRHGGFIYKLAIVRRNDDGTFVTERDRTGLVATCLINNHANVDKYNKRGKLVYNGLGQWTKAPGPDKPHNGIRMSIPAGIRVWSRTSEGSYLIEQEIITYGIEDADEFEYVFVFNGERWAVPMDEVNLL